MDPNLLEYYLDLQGRGDEDEVAHHMEFIGMNADTLENQTITVFGTDVKYYEPVRRVGRDLVVTVTDSSTRTEHNYGASILQTGLLPGSNPAAGSHTFASGLWASKPEGTWPVLEPESTPPQATVDSASYFVQIQLETEQKEIEGFEEPDKKQPWVTTYDSPLLARMDPEIIEDLRIPIKIPAPDKFEPSVEMAFEDKLQSTSMPLVTRKRIVRRSSDNQG